MIANKTTNKRQKNGSPAFPWGRHTITRAIPTYTKYTAGKTEECGCVAGAQSAHLLLLWKFLHDNSHKTLVFSVVQQYDFTRPHKTVVARMPPWTIQASNYAFIVLFETGMWQTQQQVCCLSSSSSSSSSCPSCPVLLPSFRFFANALILMLCFQHVTSFCTSICSDINISDPSLPVCTTVAFLSTFFTFTFTSSSFFFHFHTQPTFPMCPRTCPVCPPTTTSHWPGITTRIILTSCLVCTRIKVFLTPQSCHVFTFFQTSNLMPRFATLS